MNINLKYFRQEKTGLFSYYRGIPRDLQSQFGGKKFIVQSLKTHDASIAGKTAQTLALRDDERFEVLRSLLDAGLTPEETKKGANKLLTMWNASRGILHKGGLRDGGKAFEEYLSRKYKPPLEGPTQEWAR